MSDLEFAIVWTFSLNVVLVRPSMTGKVVTATN